MVEDPIRNNWDMIDRAFTPNNRQDTHYQVGKMMRFFDDINKLRKIPLIDGSKTCRIYVTMYKDN